MSALHPVARFWMICRKPSGPGSRTEPRQRYSHLSDARGAAAKLAQEADAPYLILEAVEIIRPGEQPGTGSLL